MTRSFLSGMAKVTSLTRAGKLAEATALLQRNLIGAVKTPAATAPSPEGATPVAEPPRDDRHSADVIEGTFVVVDVPRVKAPARKPRSPKSAPLRKPLAETLRDIARGGMPAQRGRQARSPVPDDRFTQHQITVPEGSRDYMLFVPHPLPATRCPVVVMLHGCTQSPQDFADGTAMNALAQKRGVIVVYPAQSSGANMNKCWNWFRPADQARGAGELALLAAITRRVLATQAADPARVYVAGLSAGGATAVLLAQAYPDIFAAAGVHSGLAAGAAQDAGSAFAAMRNGSAGTALRHQIPTIIFHGTADGTVNVANAHAVAAQAQHGIAGKHQTIRVEAAQGRAYTRTALIADGRSLGEVWLIDGAGHAWAGGSPSGSYTDPTGPDASAEMLRFFAQHRLPPSAGAAIG